MSRRVKHLYEFGPFRLDSEKPCLWRDGEPVPLEPRLAALREDPRFYQILRKMNLPT